MPTVHYIVINPFVSNRRIRIPVFYDKGKAALHAEALSRRYDRSYLVCEIVGWTPRHSKYEGMYLHGAWLVRND